jgi:hypothetical protein
MSAEATIIFPPFFSQAPRSLQEIPRRRRVPSRVGKKDWS